MLRTLKKIYSKILYLKNMVRWKIQAGKYRVKLDDKFDIKDMLSRNDGDILIVSPHPDDELIGCYSIIDAYPERVSVFYTGLTGKDRSVENKRIRVSELVDFCKKMNVSLINTENDWINELHALLDKHVFKYIFVPSPIDWHEEHTLVFKEVLNYVINLRLDTAVICYRVTVPFGKFSNCYSIMDNRLYNNKWITFNDVYPSQKYMPVKRFQINETQYVFNRKNCSAEVFMYLNKAQETKLINVVNKKNLYLYINDFKKVREMSEKEYEKALYDEIDIGKIQKKETEMLEFINRVCKENEIVYYIHAGTALGAIRHQGPIPWDDDVDIMIPINEMGRFIECIKKAMPSKYKLYYKEDNEQNKILFPRLCLRNNPPMTAYVDLFPLVGLPNGERERILFSKKSDFINRAYKFKYEDVKKVRNPFKRCIAFVLKGILRVIPFEFWQNWFDKHICRYNYEKASYVMNPCGQKGTKNIIPKKMLGTPVYVEYDGLMLPIAENYRDFLEHYYGDYMKYPDESIIKEGMAIKKPYYCQGE